MLKFHAYTDCMRKSRKKLLEILEHLGGDPPAENANRLELCKAVESKKSADEGRQSAPGHAEAIADLRNQNACMASIFSPTRIFAAADLTPRQLHDLVRSDIDKQKSLTSSLHHRRLAALHAPDKLNRMEGRTTGSCHR